MTTLNEVGGDIPDALERVRVPAYVIDRRAVVLWLNAAAEALLGDIRHRSLLTVIAPEDQARAKSIFARNLLGPPQGSDNRATVIGPDGKRLSVEVSAVPLRDGTSLIGVFGQVKAVDAEAPPRAPHPRLTQRQSEVLHHLEAGRSTEQIAAALHVTPETVRNHVQGVLKAFGVHSRLEAVTLARATGQPPP